MTAEEARGWRRLLVVGRDADEIAALVRSAAPELEVRARTAGEVTAEDAAFAEMLLAFQVPSRLAGSFAGLRWAQSTGAGVDGLLAGGAIPEHVTLTRLVGVFGPRMAEHVLARLLAFTQELQRLDDDRRARRWRPFHPASLAGRRAVVLGVGEIGAEIARALARNGVRVTGVGRSGRAVEGVPEVRPPDELRDALADAQVLVIVLPHTPETDGLVGGALLDRLPRGAFVVNVARGAVLDEPALAARLADGRLGGAALDVFQVEPLPADSPLWALENVFLSPHVAGLTTAAEAADGYVENLRRLRAGGSPHGVVDRRRGY